MSILASGIIGLIGSLLGAGASGKDKQTAKEERRDVVNDWQKKVQPKQPYYESPYLPTTDKLMMQAVLGNLGKRLGPDELSKWGIDLASLQEGVKNPQKPPGSFDVYPPQFYGDETVQQVSPGRLLRGGHMQGRELRRSSPNRRGTEPGFLDKLVEQFTSGNAQI